MAQFRFQFQSVLEHRRTVEDQRQRELAQHMRKAMILKDELRRMQQTVSQSKRDLAGALTGRVDLQQVTGFVSYSGQTTQRAEQLARKIGEVEREVEAARGRLLEATRQRKALELLRDRHHRRWLEEQRRRETLELDEIATQQYIRQMTEASA